MYYSGYGYDMFMGSASLLGLLARDRLLTRTAMYSEYRQIYEVIQSKVREKGRSRLLFLSWSGQVHTVAASSLARSPGEVCLFVCCLTAHQHYLGVKKAYRGRVAGCGRMSIDLDSEYIRANILCIK